MNTASDTPPRRSCLGSLFRVVFVLLILIAAAAAWLVFSRPGYWNVLDPKDAQVVAGAERIEQKFGTEITRVRDKDAVWKMEVTSEQINQWLANRMPQWLANQGVDEMIIDQATPMMMRIGAGRIEAAIQSGLWGLEPVVQLSYEPQATAPDRCVQLQLKAMTIGKIGVPVDAMIDFLLNRIGLPESKRHLIEKTRDRLMRVDLRLPLGDGRTVQVLGMELDEGKTTLTLRTGFGR